MSETVTEPTKEEKERQEEAERLRTKLVDRIAEMVKPNGEDKDEIKKREKELGEVVDQVLELQEKRESAEMKELKDRLGKLEEEPVSEPTVASIKAEEDKLRAKRYDGNYFLDKLEAVKGNSKAREDLAQYEGQFDSPDRQKVWASGDLEDVSLITPEIQQALPFLQAVTQIQRYCRELRVQSPAVEFPVFTGGLEVDVVPEMTPKPESEPTWELRTARVYTIAGLTEVPNQTLEDYAAARGYISSELGRATGVKETQLIYEGSGVGEPTGILNHAEITGRPATGAGGVGRDIIETTFRAIQDVRTDGFTEPNAIVMNPAAWTEVVLSFEANIGFLYGPPQGSGFPEGEPAPRLLGLPVVQDAYVTNTYGATSNQSPIIVGNFQDALLLRRSPFRIDVDTSIGFKVNSTWFRGEERMGFVIVRPNSFKIVTNVVPTA